MRPVRVEAAAEASFQQPSWRFKLMTTSPTEPFDRLRRTPSLQPPSSLRDELIYNLSADTTASGFLQPTAGSRRLHSTRKQPERDRRQSPIPFPSPRGASAAERPFGLANVSTLSCESRAKRDFRQLQRFVGRWPATCRGDGRKPRLSPRLGVAAVTTRGCSKRPQKLTLSRWCAA